MPVDWSQYKVIDVPQNPETSAPPVDWSQYKTVEAAPMSLGDMAVSAVKNIPQSAVNYGKDVWQAVSHPLDTADALAGIVRGGISSIPGVTLATVTDKDRLSWDALKQALADRYGSVENIKKTVATDPVGVLGDVASIAAPMGGLAKVAGLPKMAGLMGKIVDATEPIGLAGKATGMVPGVAWAMGKFSPEGMYASALKMGTKLPPDERAGIVKTLLQDNRVVLDDTGADKLAAKIGGLESQVGPIIDQGVAEGKVVNPLDVATRIQDVYPRYDTVTRLESQAPIDRILETFLNENTMNMPNGQTVPVAIPLDVAQAKKVNTYRENSGAYESNARPSADKDARKALARGLKEEIANAVPEITPINDELSRLYPAMDWVNAALNRSQNWNPTGMGGIMGIATGNLPGAMALDISRTPRFLSKSAINLDRLRNAWGLMAPDNDTLSMLRAAGYMDGASQ